MLNTSKSEVPNPIATVRHIYFYNSVFQVLLPANLRFVVTKKVEWEDDAMHWTVEMREIGKTLMILKIFDTAWIVLVLRRAPALPALSKERPLGW